MRIFFGVQLVAVSTLAFCAKGYAEAAPKAAAAKAASGPAVDAIEGGVAAWIEELMPEQAASSRKIPPGLEVYRGRRIAPTMSYLGADWLVRETRVREENPELLVKALQIKPGQAVCDIGCGNGYYTFRLSQLVGNEGRVLAVDIQPQMLKMLRNRAKQLGVKNVEPIQGTVVNPRLPRGELDMIVLVDVYHEFSHPEHMLRRMRSALKPTGQLVLVEFRAEDPNVPIRPEHKMTKSQVMKEIVPNGFKLAREFNDLPWQHVLFFERDPAADRFHETETKQPETK